MSNDCDEHWSTEYTFSGGKQHLWSFKLKQQKSNIKHNYVKYFNLKQTFQHA